jgi:hypothetical protein
VAARMSRAHVALAMVVAAALLYPLVVIAGGSPHFPSRGECAQRPRENDKIEAVFGRSRDRAAAVEVQRRALSLGFKGLVVERDGCGYAKVVLHGVPSLAVGRELTAEAAQVGLRVMLERELP